MADGDRPTRARLRAVVRGRVQGVNYRSFTASWARHLGVSGTVRNLPDGRSVEVYAEGRRAALNDLLNRLREGPRFARVDEIEVEWLDPSGDEGGFYVLP